MINWTELFAIQKRFDDRVVVSKGLEATDQIPWRTTAFIVELAEFANEARWFKMWSNDREPKRNVYKRKIEHGIEQFTPIDPLLEEFVDALHFLIGIGLELDLTTFHTTDDEIRVAMEKDLPDGGSLDTLFHGIVRAMTILSEIYRYPTPNSAREEWAFAFILLRVLGWRFGLTDNEIVAAFKAKDAENHARQDRGY